MLYNPFHFAQRCPDDESFGSIRYRIPYRDGTPDKLALELILSGVKSVADPSHPLFNHTEYDRLDIRGDNDFV